MSSTMNDSENIEIWSGKGRSDENFPVGSFLIRPDLRQHVHAFYDFARNADDIADSDALAAQDKIARLDRMEQILLGHVDGGAPSAVALRTSLAQSRVTPRHALDLLVAFRQDATKHRYATWEELHEYCRYSAMPVGRHVLDLHAENPAAHAPSDHLCAALQVLNHLQDCASDLRALDRCYLPSNMLERHGSGIDDLRKNHESAGLRAAFSELLDHCDHLIASARQLPALVADRRLRVECGVINALCHRLAMRLRREDPIAGRVKLHRSDVVLALLGASRHFL